MHTVSMSPPRNPFVAHELRRLATDIEVVPALFHAAAGALARVRYSPDPDRRTDSMLRVVTPINDGALIAQRAYSELALLDHTAAPSSPALADAHRAVAELLGSFEPFFALTRRFVFVDEPATLGPLTSTGMPLITSSARGVRQLRDALLTVSEELDPHS